MSYSKWQSRRFWFALWAAAMATYVVVRPLATEWAGTAASLLIGVVGGYIAADSWTKPRARPGE